MRRAVAALALAFPVAAQAAPELPVASQQRMRADIATLVGFGTRHTLSSQTDPKRGIGAARRWAEAQFRTISAACGGCLRIELPETMASGARIPQPVRLVEVLAIQPGTSRPNEVVIVMGHIDSRVSDPLDATKDAPGANDDGSGTALVLEAARLLSKQKYAGTIVYAINSGEEQGLFGGKLLADYAEKQGWTVKAVLNNDIVGGSVGSDGMVEDSHVRVFSEGPRADADDKLRAGQRRDGGENEAPSRNLSRFIADLATDDPAGLAVRQVWRADRMGRGGDHLPFEEKGYPAVRFSVGIENYDWQHQDLRTEGGKVYGDTIDHVDFAYLAKVTMLNVRALATLAEAPMPPTASAEAAVQTFTRLCWQPSAGAASYRLWQRRTDAPGWGNSPIAEVDTAGIDARAGALAERSGKGAATPQSWCKQLDGVRGDDWFFGVSAVSASGAESPIASAVPGGAFARPATTKAN